MRMADLFPDIAPASRPPGSYQEFWNSLQRDTQKFEFLRAHQAKVLEEYAARKPDIKDVAICLPTGSGKTAVGLCIGGYAQSLTRQRVLYLCPTIHLCDQVLEEAQGLGISAVPLYGTWAKVKQSDRDRFYEGSAIGVATYWTLFNSDPKVGKVDLLLMDDTHAASDQVLSPWLLAVKDDINPELYGRLREVLTRAIPGPQAAALGRPPPDREVEMVRARDWLLLADKLQPILDDLTKGTKLWFPWQGLTGRLENCFCFLSPGRVEIRPWTAPTFRLKEFHGARRRVYLSATLDRWGHLERVAGIGKVDWISLADVNVPGRRLILNLNRLLPQVDELGRIMQMATKTPRILILCRRDKERDQVIGALRATKYPGEILGAGEFDDDIARFRKVDRAALVVSNRYDGLDLGNGLCRNIVIWKLPLAVDLQEAFTTSAWALTDAAEARARHRIHQGIGRCTRREADEVIVGIVGEDLAEFLLRPHIRSALPRRIRSELLSFQKIDNPANLDRLIRACLMRTPEWREVCAKMDQHAAGLSEETQPDVEVMEHHRKESSYNERIWTGNYAAASETAQTMAQAFVSAHKDSDAAAGFYLASVAEDIGYFVTDGSPWSEQGGRLLREASLRAAGRPWFGELSQYEKPEPVQEEARQQVEGILRFLAKFPKQTAKLDEEISIALGNLEAEEAPKFHSGLRFLGESLGFASISPKRAAGADVLWVMGQRVEALYEAKTRKPSDTLSVKEVRQILSLPAETAANDAVDVPEGLRTICVTASQKIAKEESHAREKIMLLRPMSVQAFARQWLQWLSSYHKRSPRSPAEQKAIVNMLLRQAGALPGRLYSSLGVEPATRLELAT